MDLKSYMFDLGDSTTGPIGMVLRVQATDRDQAVSIAREALLLSADSFGQIRVAVPDAVQDAVENICIYLNPDSITESEIYEEEMEANHGE